MSRYLAFTYEDLTEDIVGGDTENGAGMKRVGVGKAIVHLLSLRKIATKEEK